MEVEVEVEVEVVVVVVVGVDLLYDEPCHLPLLLHVRGGRHLSLAASLHPDSANHRPTVIRATPVGVSWGVMVRSDNRAREPLSPSTLNPFSPSIC